MLKFFRKYNKIILGVGFAFLMVVFLLPQGVSQLVGDPRDRPAFEYDGGVITNGEIIQASSELQLLGSIHPAFLQVLLEVDRPEHWILLTREAEAGGFIGGPDDGYNSLSQLAQTFTDFELSQIYRNDFAQIMSQREEMSRLMEQILDRQRANAINNGQPAEAVDRILAKARGVIRLYTAYLNTQVLSQPELVLATREAIEGVVIRYAPIDASILVDEETPEPTEEEINAHYAAYRDVAPGTGEYGFGYLRDPAIRLEWMLINRREIDNAITLDPIEVNVHWQRNKDRFGESFAEAQPRVERELRDQQIERAMGIARQVVKGMLLQAQGNLPEGANGIRELPENWSQIRPSFNSIGRRVAAEIKERLDIDIVAPDTLFDTRWLTKTATQELPVIGFSRIAVGRTPVIFPDFVFSMPSVGGDGKYGVQAQLAYPDPLTSATGNLIFFRVVGVRPQSPPDDIAEVREQIVHNLKRLTEYENVVAQTSDILESAAEIGLEDATIPYHVNIIYPDVTVTQEVFTRPTKASPDDVAALREAVLAKAAKIDPTIPLPDAPLADRLVIEPLPSALVVPLMEITQMSPLSRERFQNIASQVLLNERRLLRRDFDWPFSAERMNQRYNAVNLMASDDDADDPNVVEETEDASEAS